MIIRLGSFQTNGFEPYFYCLFKQKVLRSKVIPSYSRLNWYHFHDRFESNRWSNDGFLSSVWCPFMQRFESNRCIKGHQTVFHTTLKINKRIINDQIYSNNPIFKRRFIYSLLPINFQKSLYIIFIKSIPFSEYFRKFACIIEFSKIKIWTF